jgi:Holliday junction resolvase RusA-like endonuclease
MLLTFTVPDEPIPMPRPRVAVRGGKAHAYTPTRASEAMWRIRQSAIAALGDRPRFEGAVLLTAVAFVRMPANIPKRDRLTTLPTKRPDVDNFAKTVLDGLSVLWADDAQVTDLCVRKRFAVDSSPRWEIRVESV